MTVVLDASAVLSIFFDEPGADRVVAELGHAIISAVNLQEVFQKLLAASIRPADALRMVEKLELDVREHDTSAALNAAMLHQATRIFGRGLGDRSCLALAIEEGVPALTSDREWSKIEVEGLEIVFIR
jgi:ribonuclease VapC